MKIMKKFYGRKELFMTTDERLERIEAMLRYIIRELNYVPEAPKQAQPALVLVRGGE